MRVAGLAGVKQFVLLDKPKPRCKPGYSVVRVESAAMCNEYVAYRDWDFRERNRADSLGHEAAGVIAETSTQSPFSVGDRVVAMCGYSCGECRVCRDGFFAHCPNPEDPLEVNESESGECAFAEFMLKPNWLLRKVPDDIPLDHAVMVNCGLGPTFGAMRLMNVTRGQTLLITGLGPVGLGGVINGVARGATVVCAARNPYRVKLAIELGASLVVDPTDPTAKQQIQEIAGDLGVDAAVDCISGAGRQTSVAGLAYQRLAIESVRPKGQVCFLADSHEIRIHVWNDLVLKGISVHGSLDFNLRDFDQLMGVIREQRGRIEKFITHRFALEDVGRAFELQLTGECCKLIVRPQEQG